MRCQGVTSIGPRCKKMTHSADGFCCQHKTQVPIPLYPVTDNWPAARTIRPYVRTGIGLPLLAETIYANNRLLVMKLANVETDREKTYEKRKYIIICAELIKANSSMVYDNPAVQPFVATFANTLDSFPDLVEYVEDFRRKCIKSHRDAARKRMIAFYFNRCEDLCDDMIWEIMNRV